MKENVKSIEEFFGLFKKAAKKFEWRLKAGRVHEERHLLRTKGHLCPIEAIFEDFGAFGLTEEWDELTRDTIIDSADDMRSPHYTTRYDQEVRARLLKICGLNE